MVTPPRFEELLPHCGDPKMEAMRATLLIIPNVSHGGPQQNPAAFHNAVAQLLDREGSGRRR